MTKPNPPLHSDHGLPPAPSDRKSPRSARGLRRLNNWVESHRVLVCGSLALCFVALHAGLALYFRVPSPAAVIASDYCEQVIQRASALSTVHGVAALVLALFALLSTVLVVSSDKSGFWARNAARIVLVCTTVAFVLYQRADAAVQLAAAANDARAGFGQQGEIRGAEGGQETAFDGRLCAAAWSAWVRTRLDSSEIGRSVLSEALEDRGRDVEALGAALRGLEARGDAVGDATIRAVESGLDALKGLAEGDRDEVSPGEARELLLRAEASLAEARRVLEGR